MPEPADRPPLRDQIIERAAEWAHAYPISSNAICQTDDRAWRLARIWGEQIARIAVMPVVEAETAALRQRIEEVEDQRDQALAWQDTAERELRNAERRLDAAERIAAALEAERDKARDAIATERRGKLAAQAAVRRGREIHRPHDCGRHVSARTPVPCANHGLCEGCGAPHPCRTYAALTIKPKETR